MKNQQGFTIVIAMIFLGIISMVGMYAIENSSLQSKMVANSLYITKTYQECRNEQEAQILRFNLDVNNAAFANLLEIAGVPTDELESEYFSGLLNGLNTSQTAQNALHPPASTIAVNWAYIKDEPAGRSGYNIDTESIHKSYLYETDCIATYNDTSNSQTLGAVVNGLKQSGIQN